jgi:hypothetical protein
MRFAWLFLGLALWFLPATVAQPQTAPSDFLFPEDNGAIPYGRDQFNKTARRGPALAADPWLSAPLTRLDYVLISIDQKLKADLGPVVSAEMERRFEPKPGGGMPGTVELFARYQADFDRLTLNAVILAGKPKQPMTDFCKWVGLQMLALFPQEPRSTWGHLLGVLVRERDPPDAAATGIFLEMPRKLADSTLVIVQVLSSYKVNDRFEMFDLTCRKQGKDQDFELFKYKGAR